MTVDFATDLTALATGDRVLTRAGWGHYTYAVGVVRKVTTTQVVVESGGREERYSKARGFRLIGSDSYHRGELVAATERAVTQYRGQRAAELFRDAAHLSGETILARIGWERVEELSRLLTPEGERQ